MKNIFFTTALAFTLLFCGCESFTDIDPKGKNVLDKVEDLDYLLNYDYPATYSRYIPQLMDDLLIGYPYNTIDMVPGSSIGHMVLTYQDHANRGPLSEWDSPYTGYSKIIGQVANPVIKYADAAKGDRHLANVYKAEAYILRAWCNYFMICYFSKAYDPTTAATDGGIPLLKEDTDIFEAMPKATVQETYESILADIESALALNSLPEQGKNRMRVGKSFAYALKSWVLLSMRDYEGAYEAAGESLKRNNVIDDHNNMWTVVKNIDGEDKVYFTRPLNGCAEDLFVDWNSWAMQSTTQSLRDSFEPGAIFIENDNTSPGWFGNVDNWMWGNTDCFFTGSGLTTVDMYLTQAECLIRKGELGDAMALINKLRKHRIYKDVYADISAADKSEAIKILKRVWRCENFYGPRNFMNWKRWNTDPEFRETLHRHVRYWDNDGNIFTRDYYLEPDSPLWIWAFPTSGTLYNPNLTQNF